MRITRRKIVQGLFVILALLIGGALFFNQAVHHVPSYYEEALHIPLEELEVEGEALEKQFMEMHNQWERSDRWEATFTDSQINGWLAVDLIEKFPTFLPPSISDPRVAIDEEWVQIACLYQEGRFNSVLNLALKIYLTDSPNVVAIRIVSARAGLIGMPMQRVIDKIREQSERSNMQIFWTEQEGDPLALITLPTQFVEEGSNTIVDHIKQSEGQIYMAGRPAKLAEIQSGEQLSGPSLSSLLPPSKAEIR